MQDHLTSNAGGFELKLTDWSPEERAEFMRSLNTVEEKSLDVLREIAASLRRIECLLARQTALGVRTDTCA